MELGMDLEGTRNAYSDTKEAEARQEAGEEITLLIKLPDGSEHAHSFVLGVTVAFVKLIIEKEYEHPVSKLVLKANGKVLIDPLSLSDCPGFQAGVTVAVEVTLS